jgi:hypothetical protein
MIHVVNVLYFSLKRYRTLGMQYSEQTPIPLKCLVIEFSCFLFFKPRKETTPL